MRDDGGSFVVVNSGSLESCWLCCTPKPKRPKLVWTKYIEACKKAKVEPGYVVQRPPKATTRKAVTRNK